MIVDTGSNVTLVRPDVIRLRHDSNQRRGTFGVKMTTVTGAAAPILAKQRVTINVGGLKSEHDVYVVDIADEFILGLDFLRMHDCVIDVVNSILQTPESDIELVNRRSVVPDEVGNVSCLRTTTIPAFSEAIINVRCRRVHGPMVIVEPVEECDEIPSGVMVAKCLVRNSEDCVPVRVLNLNHTPVTLKKGTTVGRCSQVSAVVKPINNRETPKEKDLPVQLRELLDRSSEYLAPYQRTAVTKLLRENQDVFSCGQHDLGRTTIVQHRIDTGQAQPIKQTPRRIPLAKHAEVDELLDEMLRHDVIEPSTSPWASPVVLVKKKDGTTRFCVDFRKVNDVTRKDSYPLPRIDDTLDALGEAQWFSTLDLKSGYWQVEVQPSDREKTAFTIPGKGLWQFKVLPFGLCNAPATFERLMEHVLPLDQCLVYLDDIVVPGSSFEEEVERLRSVFARLRAVNLKLMPKKCDLFQKKVGFLGHVISTEGIATDPEKTRCVKEWPRPRDKTELRSFLGLCTYYRRFVRDFSTIARPLHQLTEQNRKFAWTDESEAAFVNLKKALTSPPVLAYPRREGRFVLDTDASDSGIGAVLSQMQDGKECVIAYFSKVLQRPERNYCVTRRELLAIIRAIDHFHHYLYGRRFLLRTDHASLRWLLNFRNPEGQLARWLEKLQGYDFEIQHRAGRLHTNADTLSRRPCELQGCRHCERQEDINVRLTGLQRDSADDQQHAWEDHQIQQDQREDHCIKYVMEWKDRGERPEWNSITDQNSVVKCYWNQWDSLVLKDGVLHRRWESADGQSHRLQLILPRKRIPEVLEELHSSASGGHFGVNKTLGKVRERFYWVNCRDDVEEWCRRCDDCAARKGPKTRSRGRMQQYNVGAPFERIAVDVMGPLPESSKGNRYLLVAMDYFTKWPEVIPVRNQEATTIAEALVENVFSRFGVPSELHSDQGRNFESSVFRDCMNLLGIKKTRTTPLHPQSDGMVERLNRTLEQYLSMFVSRNQKDWDTKVPLFLMAYRSATHDTTGVTPARMFLGRDIVLPADIMFGRSPEHHEDLVQYAHDLRQTLNEVHDFARERIRSNSDRMKARYDLKANERHFAIGEKVWLYNPRRTKGISPKLQKDWEGPYIVVTRINDVVYRIGKGPRLRKIVHLNRLAPYQGDAAIPEESARDEQI